VNAHPLDTYRLVQKLKGVGFSEEQAGAVTDALRETREFDLSEIATKSDIRALEAATKADIQALAAATKSDIRALEAATKADIQALQADIRALEASSRADNRTQEAYMTGKIAESQRVMVQWAVGLFLAQLACIAGLIKFLH
jgi:hypothetical protein